MAHGHNEPYGISWRRSFCATEQKEVTRSVSRTNWGLEKGRCSNIANVLQGRCGKLGSQNFRGGGSDRHRETAEFIEQGYGFKNCIGIVDGSLIRLSEVPAEHGQSYWCRKKYPAVSYARQWPTYFADCV